MIPIEVFLVALVAAYFYGRHSGVKAFKNKYKDFWE